MFFLVPDLGQVAKLTVRLFMFWGVRLFTLPATPVRLFTFWGFGVLVTGSVADRFNRKIIGSIAIAGELLCSVFLGLYALSEPTAVWPLFVIAVLFGTFRAFAAPSVRSLPPMVAPDGALPRTIALYSATWTSAAIIGPASGGLIYASSPALAYFVSAVLIGAGVAFLLAVKIARPFVIGWRLAQGPAAAIR